MQITFQITKGEAADRKKQFSLSGLEADNVTLGRSSRKSEKLGAKNPHVHISSGDLRLSRWHFMIQRRPPNVYICDISSRNHTYVNDFEEGQHITGSVELKDGDVIKAGRTHLKTHIVPDEPGKQSTFVCTKCGKRLEGLDGKSPDEITDLDFVCGECKSSHIWFPDKKKPEKKRWLKKSPEEKERTWKIACHNCGEQAGELADRDGRAEELKDVALYLCPKCAASASKQKKKIGDYFVLSELGIGGMAVVHKAVHKKTGRLVAIKDLLPDTILDDHELKVFHREISVTRDLRHPNIVCFYDSFTKWRKPYLVTEYLPGGNAQELPMKRKEPLSVDETLRIILQVLEGLSLAHKSGIIHRDVKPPNILFDKSGTAKLSDMGFAKSFELAGQSGITGLGEFAGTLMYMAPEQITDYRFVKPPADVYSVGVCLYYFITGKFPYHFPSELEQLLNAVVYKKVKNPYSIIIEEDPIPILERKPDLPRGLAKTVDRCLRKDPAKRFGDAGILMMALKKSQ